jgi:hypothetical protein
LQNVPSPLFRGRQDDDDALSLGPKGPALCDTFPITPLRVF